MEGLHKPTKPLMHKNFSQSVYPFPAFANKVKFTAFFSFISKKTNLVVFNAT